MVTDLEDEQVLLSVQNEIQNECPFEKKGCDSGTLKYLFKIIP